jgi:hypothetical protein
MEGYKRSEKTESFIAGDWRLRGGCGRPKQSLDRFLAG